MSHECDYIKCWVSTNNGDVYIADICTLCKKVILLEKVVSVSEWALTTAGYEIDVSRVNNIE